MSENRKLRVAGVGAGYFARFHYEAWSRHQRVELVGICDVDLGRAKNMATQFGGAPSDQVREMLDTLKPDLFDIATPPGSHVEMIRLAGEFGINCVSQKPLAPTLREAETAVAIARDAGIKLFVHENFRFQPWYRKIKNLIDEGFLGDVYQASFRLRPGDGQGKEAYLDRQPYFQQMEKFLIYETAVHWVDTFRYLLGNPVAVTADLRQLNPVIAGEDAGIVIFEMEGGKRALFDGNRLGSHRAKNPRLTMGEFWLDGSNGTLMLDGEGRITFTAHGSDRDETIPFDWKDVQFGGDCVYALQDHVVRHILDGSPAENLGEDYLTVTRIQEAIYTSNQTKQRVALKR